MLTQALSWHWIFFVNAPVGAVAIAAGWLLLAGEQRTGLRALKKGADAAGALLVTAGLMTAVYAIVETSSYGWGAARPLGTGGYRVAFGTGAGLAAAALVLAAAVLRPRGARRPAESPDRAERADQAEPADHAA